MTGIGEVLHELTGEGKSPQTVKGAYFYVTNPVTQGEAAQKYGCSQTAIRDIYPRIIREFNVEPAPRDHNTGPLIPLRETMTALDVANNLRELCGLERRDTSPLSKSEMAAIAKQLGGDRP